MPPRMMSSLGKLLVTFAGLQVALMADQLTTRDGHVLSGKAAFTKQATVKIAGQTVESKNILKIQFSSGIPKAGLSDVYFKLYQGN